MQQQPLYPDPNAPLLPTLVSPALGQSRSWSVPLLVSPARAFPPPFPERGSVARPSADDPQNDRRGSGDERASQIDEDEPRLSQHALLRVSPALIART